MAFFLIRGLSFEITHTYTEFYIGFTFYKQAFISNRPSQIIVNFVLFHFLEKYMNTKVPKVQLKLADTEESVRESNSNFTQNTCPVREGWTGKWCVQGGDENIGRLTEETYVSCQIQR